LDVQLFSLSLSLSLLLHSLPPARGAPVKDSKILNFQEIDYTKEAANAELFASNFKNMDYVKVPSIVWEYTTPQV
jgi:hypothetical protein